MEELAAWQRWREERRESIAGEDGWLTLIALAWLERGESTVGSDPASAIVLPADRAPRSVGRVMVEESGTSFIPDPAGDVRVNGTALLERIALAPDDPGPPTILEVGSLRMHIVARADRRGLRVKDRASPARESFAGIEVFDHDLGWRLRARLVPAAPGTMVPIVNVLGMSMDEPLAGHLELEIEGRTFSLLAVFSGDTPEDGLFVMFRDATTDAEETYPAGRYVEVTSPDENGETWIDFNRAYSPPCAFTAFATCPLAPRENTLPIAIRAGERNPGAH